MLKLNSCPVCNDSSIFPFLETNAQMHSVKEVFNFDQCSNCLLVFLNPRVPPEKLKNYYSSYYLPYRGPKAWGKFEKLVQSSQKKLDAKRVRFVGNTKELSNNSLILDIGCGNPSFLEACKKSLKCNTMGIDFSDEGWKNELLRFKDITLQVAEIKDLKSNIRPDVITMWHYLEHDYKPFENLVYLKSVSKSSTILIIEIPNFDSSSRKKYGKNWAGWHTPRHISLFSPNNIQLLLSRAGWKVEETLTYGTLHPYLLFWMSEMEEKGIQWNKNMEEEFIQFILGMIKFLPMKWIEKKSSLGVMTVVAKPA